MTLADISLAAMIHLAETFPYFHLIECVVAVLNHYILGLFVNPCHKIISPNSLREKKNT